MNAIGWLQIGLYLVVLLALVKPLGWSMARVLDRRSCGLDRVFGSVERMIYRAAGTRATSEMPWRTYAMAALAVSLIGCVVVYALQRLQGLLPANPQELGAVSPDSSFNTAVSFMTNTNWQGYAGETTMSYLTQMLGLGVQNFLSAATGIAVLIALVRGIARTTHATIGNFWVDLTRSTLYILLPLSILLAVALPSQGVPQTFQPYHTVELTEAIIAADGTQTTTQTIPLGPAASQIAIKQLGTNCGGFFNTNSAHPLENPTPLSNFLQLLAILLIPAALCWTYGELVGDRRQGWALLLAMTVLFVALTVCCAAAEGRTNPVLVAIGADAGMGNMEGKETRLRYNQKLWMRT